MRSGCSRQDRGAYTRLRRAEFANQRVEVFKPAVDTRYSDEEVVVSRYEGHSLRSTPVESSQTILPHVGQRRRGGHRRGRKFFDESLTDVCRALASQGIRVIVAGLDMDFTGRPLFGPMPALMAVAEHVTSCSRHLRALRRSRRSTPTA